MSLRCPNCAFTLSLFNKESATYFWGCTCRFALDTGISSEVDLSEFLNRVGNRPDDQHWGGYVVLDHPRFADAKRVYMPQALAHFIDCTWGGCYNGAYERTIKPYLNSIEVVEYITRTCVMPGNAWRTRGGGLMYDDLYHRLLTVDDQAVAEHMRTNCNPGSGDD